MIDFPIRVDRWLSAEKQLTKEIPSALNREGYMCCMGDYLSQQGIPDEKLNDFGMPASLVGVYPEYEDIVEVIIPKAVTLAFINDRLSAASVLLRCENEEYLQEFELELKARAPNEPIGEDLRLRILKKVFATININLIIPS